MGSNTDGEATETPLLSDSVYNTILGRPTDSSIAISVLAAQAGDKVFIEYSTQLDAAQSSLLSTQLSAPVASISGEPMVVDLTGLSKDTKYYYRVHYQAEGSGDALDKIHSFRTQRAKASAFHFGLMANATSLMLVNGNHEQAHLANIGGIFNNASVWAADGRLKYYPLPAPGAFYTGDETKLPAANGYPSISARDGLLRDYYAFTWGDALFVTIDPYWHSAAVSPDSTLFADPEPKWGATLGDEQYSWLKKTLETSDAKWKFVFAHHVNGNNRGGAAIVGVQEWGGEPGFATNRPGWAKPVHQLFADTKVTIIFQGHDHMYAREKVDGVVYQEVPNPGDNSYFAYNCDAYGPPSITWQEPAGYGVKDDSTCHQSYERRCADTLRSC